MNVEFQRIARRDKKAFLSDQCKEIEENNRMGKTGDVFNKMRDTKGTFHAKMGSIKDRNGMDLTEAEDIKNRWQKKKKEQVARIQRTVRTVQKKVKSIVHKQQQLYRDIFSMISVKLLICISFLE